ncbi:MAG: RHS repeat-associated core domain-containing protein, partial [Candidatus Acidiferrales bacterium]
ANPVQELAGTTPTANLLTGLGVDERFQRTDSAGAANFLTDALGSTLALTDNSGNTLASYTYEPFGNTTISGTSANTYQYTGRENDGTGVYFYRARYYSPTLQRFLAEDPVGLGAGSNLYVYALDNPIAGLDPTGLDAQFGFSGGVTVFPLVFGSGGSAGVGISTNWTLSGTSFYFTAQGDAMVGLGLYAGAGAGPVIGHTNGPLTTGTADNLYGEADAGWGLSGTLSGTLPTNPDGSIDWSNTGTSLSPPVGKGAGGLGGGFGGAIGIGEAWSYTHVSPTLGQMWNKIWGRK